MIINLQKHEILISAIICCFLSLLFRIFLIWCNFKPRLLELYCFTLDFLLVLNSWLIAYQLKDETASGQGSKRSLDYMDYLFGGDDHSDTDCYDYLTPNTTAEVIDQTVPRFDRSFTTYEDFTAYAFGYLNHHLPCSKSKC